MRHRLFHGARSAANTRPLKMSPKMNFRSALQYVRDRRSRRSPNGPVVIVDQDGYVNPSFTRPSESRAEADTTIQRAAAGPAILEVTSRFIQRNSPVADNVDLFDLVHPDVGGEHRSVGVHESDGRCGTRRRRFRPAPSGRRQLVCHRDRVIAEPLLSVRYGRAARIDTQNGCDD